ncbi:acetoacetate decarboxylase family protein [Sorangium sp. So ce296]|uniref:acetoacetate decarboxylase family protein n=1 Tax=Sorangium sp. So ce296 TaxID=3133296 RepID=UPI003F60CE44
MADKKDEVASQQQQPRKLHERILEGLPRPQTSSRSHKTVGKLVLAATSEPLAGVELELWDRDALRGDFLGRGITDAHGAFQIYYNPVDAGPFDRPDLDLRVIERSEQTRLVVQTFHGADDVQELVYDFGTCRLARAPRPAPLDRVAPPRDRFRSSPLGMPSAHPLCLPPPFSLALRARLFLVDVDPGWLGADIPPCLGVLPGLEGKALWGVMDYSSAFSSSDPTGAVYPYRELVIGCFVREHARMSEVGLFINTIYISSDVMMVTGREMYGFPKKLAEIAIGSDGTEVRRPGLAPGETAGNVHPIELVRGTWHAAAKHESFVDHVARAVADKAAALGARGAALGMSNVFELPFYTHQVIPTPAGDRSCVSRVWRTPLHDVRVSRAVLLSAARFEIGPSTVDPIYLLAPGNMPVVEAAAGVEMDVSFVLNEGEIVAQYSPTSAPTASPAEVRP